MHHFGLVLLFIHAEFASENEILLDFLKTPLKKYVHSSIIILE